MEPTKGTGPAQTASQYVQPSEAEQEAPPVNRQIPENGQNFVIKNKSLAQRTIRRIFLPAAWLAYKLSGFFGSWSGRIDKGLNLAATALKRNDYASAASYLVDLHRAEKHMKNEQKQEFLSLYSFVKTAAPESIARCQTLNDAFAERHIPKHLVIVGAPGNGKSALVNALMDLQPGLNKESRKCVKENSSPAKQSYFEQATVAFSKEKKMDVNVYTSGDSFQKEDPVSHITAGLEKINAGNSDPADANVKATLDLKEQFQQADQILLSIDMKKRMEQADKDVIKNTLSLLEHLGQSDKLRFCLTFANAAHGKGGKEFSPEEYESYYKEWITSIHDTISHLPGGDYMLSSLEPLAERVSMAGYKHKSPSGPLHKHWQAQMFHLKDEYAS